MLIPKPTQREPTGLCWRKHNRETTTFTPEMYATPTTSQEKHPTTRDSLSFTTP